VFRNNIKNRLAISVSLILQLIPLPYLSVLDDLAVEANQTVVGLIEDAVRNSSLMEFGLTVQTRYARQVQGTWMCLWPLQSAFSS